MQRRLNEPESSSPFGVVEGFVEHPYLKPRAIEARDFQLRIAERASQANTLVVVPTGLGKTVISALVAAEVLRMKRGTVLIVAPTRPLAAQHAERMRSFLRDEGLVHLLAGSVAPAQRKKLWASGLVVAATPQTIRNDLGQGRYDLAALGLVIFDEAHRAVGDYAYVELGQKLRFENPRCRVLGLTASPGSKKERLQEVMSNLGCTHLEVRQATSEDVRPYVQQVGVEPKFVELTPIVRRVAKPFHELMDEMEGRLRGYGFVQGKRPYGLTKRELVLLTQSLGRRGHYAGLYAAAVAHYARLAIDYAEVYGLDPLRRFLDRMAAKPDLKRNEKSFLNHPRTKEARDLLAKGIEESHPKVEALLGALTDSRNKNPKTKAIVFTQYRDAVHSVVDALRAAGWSAERFVGQAARGEEAGLDQGAQRDVLERFGRGDFQVLVSTSIGEEGIDVPQVDLVVFYDAVPSEIRAIQRRGRTGRTVAGRVLVLVTKGSSDEGAFRAQLAKEAKMNRLVARYS